MDLRATAGGLLVPRRALVCGLRGLGALALVLIAFTSCANPSLRITYDSLGDLPATADGLYRVQATGVGAVYLKPGARFADYDAVVIDPVTVAYKSEPAPASSIHRGRGGFALDPAGMDRLTRIFQESFQRELARSDLFAIVAEAEPGAMRVSGHIVNLVINFPPARGNDVEFVTDTGEMTLILEVRDSQTGELLARIADRRAIRPGSAGLLSVYRSWPVKNWGAVRDIVSNWARSLRQALEDLRELPEVPLPAVPTDRNAER